MYQRLLVPLDGSATAALALDEAAQLARLAGATVVLLHVVDAMDHVTGFEPPLVHIQEVRPTFLRNGQALLDAARQTLEAQGVTAETVLLESQGERVSQLIADQASQAGCDLIVLGTHGRRGVNRLLLGSDAEQVARIAAMPVMLVRPRGQERPPPARHRRKDEPRGRAAPRLGSAVVFVRLRQFHPRWHLGPAAPHAHHRCRVLGARREGLRIPGIGHPGKRPDRAHVAFDAVPAAIRVIEAVDTPLQALHPSTPAQPMHGDAEGVDRAFATQELATVQVHAEFAAVAAAAQVMGGQRADRISARQQCSHAHHRGQGAPRRPPP